MSGSSSKSEVVGVGIQKNMTEMHWDVTDILSLSGEMNYESPRFFFCDSAWHLRLFVNGAPNFSSEGYIGLFLYRESDLPFSAVFCLFIKKTDGTEVYVMKDEKKFDTDNCCFGKAKAIERSKLIQEQLKFLSSGTLSVGCLILNNEEQVVEGIKGEYRKFPAGRYSSKFHDDFEKLFLSDDGSDVILEVKRKQFKAHQNILKARSSVFESMLTHDMSEKITGLVSIEDCTPSRFRVFLRYLYCGKVDSITPRNVCSLYRTADKYDVQDLKSECVAFMKSHIGVDNFYDVMTLALQHEETDLVNQATDFFANNMLAVVKTATWEDLMIENPIQTKQLIIKGLSAQKKLKSLD